MTSAKTDKIGIKFGMWLFLYTEIMLFGGLFILYAAYYQAYTEDFILGGKELNLLFGTINTLILLVSSFTVASAVHAFNQNQNKLCSKLLYTSVGLGLVFLINKYFEWSHKIDLGIYLNSPELVEGPPGRNIFFGLYYLVTGLHGLHVIIGMVLLLVCAVLAGQEKITADTSALPENCGLYWHLVDLIWIFVFPLFYLIL